ncbi:MAG: type II secretion system F family protein, partial [Isosphaeraceae bacterium]
MAEPDDPRQRLTSEEAARFSQEIAAITSAGLPLAPGLRATAEEMPPGRLRSALNAVASGIEAGAPLDVVVADPSNRLPAHLRGLVLIGQRTGKLGPILSRFVSFMNVGVELRRKLWNSLAYPLLAVFFAAAVFGFIASTIIPAFEHIFADFGIPLPVMTVAVIQIGRLFAMSWAGLVELAIALVVIAVFTRLLTGADQRRGFLSTIPVIGQVWRNTSLAEFCHLLALLLESEVPLPEAASLTAEGIGDARIARACRALSLDLKSG